MMTSTSTSGIAETLEAQETGVARTGSLSAIGLLVLSLQASTPWPAVAQAPRYVPFAVDHSTASSTISSDAVDEWDLLQAFNRVYSHLLEESVELPPEDRSLIYENIWDLYA